MPDLTERLLMSNIRVDENDDALTFVSTKTPHDKFD
jgi:hypothetical protein